MGITKAFKLAIECVKIIRRERHAFGEGLYTKFGVESQENHHKKYKEMTDVINLLEELIENDKPIRVNLRD